jgi:DNA-binding transcriptional MerR regulator
MPETPGLNECHSVTQVPPVSRRLSRARSVLRVHEAAVIHGLSSQELLRRCEVIEAFNVKSASSIIPPDVLERALDVPPEPPKPHPGFNWDELSEHEQRILVRWLSAPSTLQNFMRATFADDAVGLLTTEEAARLANVSPNTIRKWRERGHLYPSDRDYRRAPLYVPRLVIEAARRHHQASNQRIEARDPDELLTVKAAASWLSVGPSTIRTWAHRGKITAAGTDSRGRNLYRAGDLALIHAPAKRNRASHA